MEDKKLQAAIEAILFTMGEAVEAGQIARALDLETKKVRDLMEDMIRDYEDEKRGITIIKLEDSYQLCTKKDYYPQLIKIASHAKKPRLTDVMLETLSIIAYKQPVTKVEIEKIRGVKSDHAVNKLVEYSLVEEVGRLDAPGRPILFGTTREFLRSFGVETLEDLPRLSAVQLDDFRAEAEEELQEKL